MSDGLRVLSLPTDAQPRIVEELERLTELARTGQLRAFYVIYDIGGEPHMSRDGMSFNEWIYVTERHKHRHFAGCE